MSSQQADGNSGGGFNEFAANIIEVRISWSIAYVILFNIELSLIQLDVGNIILILFYLH